MRAASSLCGALFTVCLGLVGAAAHAADPLAQTELSRDQAERLLQTLQNPQERERFTATLEAYVQALPAAPAPAGTPQPAPSATAAAAPPAAGTPRGPSFLKRVFARVASAGLHLGQEARSITDLPALNVWLAHRFSDPAERTAFYRGGLRIALIVAVTLGAEMVLRTLIRRRRAAPSARSPVPPVRATLRRLAAQVGAVAGAAVIGNAAISSLADLPVARLIAFGVVNTYLALRFMLALVQEFVHAEPASSAADSAPRRVHPGLRALWVVFFSVVAMQLLCVDITEELGAPEFVQEALAKSIALIAHIVAILIVLVSRPMVSGWIRRHSRPGTHWAVLIDAVAAIWPTVAICAIAGSWLVWAMDVPDAYREIIRLIVATLTVLLISRFAGRLLLAGLERRVSALAGAAAGTFGARLFGYRRGARLLLQAALIMVTLLALTEAWGLPSLAWLGEGHSGHRFAMFLLQLLVLAVGGVACWEAADLMFERRVNSLMGASSLSRATRLRTLRPIIRFALLVIIALLVVMTALDSIGINVGPLLAGASIVGVALGFGSQKLVQDFITGIFLLIEDAMDVGDWVTLAGVSGTVEHISIRSIRLRAGDGSVHLVPFSSVTSVNNSNRGLGNAAVAVNIDPSEDTDRVSSLLADIAREMRQEPTYAAGMHSDLQLWGVDKVDGSLVTIAGQIVCSDAARWGVQREFNRRMKQRLEQAGVRLAIPHQTLRIAAAVRADKAAELVPRP